jgi:hypothetical protein
MPVKAPQKAKKGKKQRKWGRNKIYCSYYALTHKREKNKIKRLKKHLVRFPQDQCAIKAMEHCELLV